MSNQNIWAEIDQHVASLVGQRVFYNYHGKKTLGFVVKAGFDRDNEGRILNVLVIFPVGEGIRQVTSYLSSDRVEGSFDIAQPGDVTDSGSTKQPEKEVVQEVVEASGFNTNPLPPVQQVEPTEGEETVVQRDKKLRKQGRNKGGLQ